MLFDFSFTSYLDVGPNGIFLCFIEMLFFHNDPAHFTLLIISVVGTVLCDRAQHSSYRASSLSLPKRSCRYPEVFASDLC